MADKDDTMTAIAIKIDYISPRTNKRNVSHGVLTDFDPDKHSISHVIETLQRKIKEGHVLNRLPSITFQVCPDMVSAMVASSRL